MDQAAETTPLTGQLPRSFCTTKNISTWILLLTGVLTVPAFAIIVVAAIHPTGPGSAIIFVLSCWLCVYLGLRMMKNPQIASPYLLERISFTADEKNQCVSAIAEVSQGIEQWKQQYEKCDSTFMNLSKQPTWGYLDDLMHALERIGQSVERDATITFPDLKSLNAWVMSSKSATVEAYLQALRSAYAYAKSAAADQGHDLDSQYPELEKGMLLGFEKAPNQAKAFAWELLGSIRKKYPFIAAQLNHEVQKVTNPPFTLFGKKGKAA
jgi:hypothetical protein